MKDFSLEDFVKNLNSFFNDEELNKLHERLRYPISNMTTKEKFNFGLDSFKNIQEEYISRIQEILNSKFNLQIEKLEEIQKLL